MTLHTIPKNSETLFCFIFFKYRTNESNVFKMNLQKWCWIKHSLQKKNYECPKDYSPGPLLLLANGTLLKVDCFIWVEYNQHVKEWKHENNLNALLFCTVYNNGTRHAELMLKIRKSKFCVSLRQIRVITFD